MATRSFFRSNYKTIGAFKRALARRDSEYFIVGGNRSAARGWVLDNGDGVFKIYREGEFGAKDTCISYHFVDSAKMEDFYDALHSTHDSVRRFWKIQEVTGHSFGNEE